MFSSYQVNVPQIDADIDREKAKTHGVAISDIFDTLQVYLGSLYANDFNRFGTVPTRSTSRPSSSSASNPSRSAS